MQIPESPDHIAALAFEYDELRANVDFPGDDVRAIHIKNVLEEYLSVNGALAVLSVPNSLELTRLSSAERREKVVLVRHGLIEAFLLKRSSETSNSPPKPLDDRQLPFRARMKRKEGESKTDPGETPEFAFFSTGVASFIYGLIALGLLGWASPTLYDMLTTKLQHWAAAGLLITATLLLYVATMTVLWRRVTASLSSLIEPTADTKQLRPTIMAGYIASALVAGITIMLAVLIVNYYTHSAAADADGAKEVKVAEIVAGHNHLWGVMTAIPHGANVVSIPGAEFGSFAGTFGDFFGGVVNPVLTFGTLIALTITVLMQRTQLTDEKHQAKEAARVSNLQTFETTFFNLLNLHSDTIPGLQFNTDSMLSDDSFISFGISPGIAGLTTGREVFTAVMKALYDVVDLSDQGLSRGLPNPERTYQCMQERHNHVLGHYFRNLFQILAYVDRHGTRLQPDDIDEEYKLRKRYTNMLRAQLSSHELCLLFFNCSGHLVDDGAFRDLLIEWEILEHIPLRYRYQEHYIYLEGFETHSIGHMISQYLGQVTFNQRNGGAFGNNPVVEEYLIMRKVFETASRQTLG